MCNSGSCAAPGAFPGPVTWGWNTVNLFPGGMGPTTTRGYPAMWPPSGVALNSVPWPNAFAAAGTPAAYGPAFVAPFYGQQYAIQDQGLAGNGYLPVTVYNLR